jgi:hypothetical protein
MAQTVVKTEPMDMKALVLSCFVPNLKVSVVIKIIKIKNHTSP